MSNSDGNGSLIEVIPLSGAAEVKPWGTTRCIIRTPHYEQHVLEIKRGGFCSIHYHERKFQTIYVLSGELCIRTFEPTGKLLKEFVLKTGDQAECTSHMRHQFYAPVNCVATEIYTGREVDPADIVRLSEGGCDVRV